MEPLLIILVPGVIGGIVLSLFITRLRRTTAPTFVPKRLEPTSPSLINMSSIKVEGLGGLGMVAAVIAVGSWRARAYAPARTAAPAIGWCWSTVDPEYCGKNQ